MNDIEKALNYLRDTAKQYAIAKGQCDYMKEFRKSKKAWLMVQAESEGIHAGNKQEVYAYAHPEYITFLDGLKVAIEEEARLSHMLKAAEYKIEIYRTQQANQRFERKAYNAWNDMIKW